MQKLHALLALMALIVVPAFAQTPEQNNVSVATSPSVERQPRFADPLTLPVALEWAMQSNPALAAAHHEVEAVEGAVRQAGVIRNPELAALAEDTRHR